MDTDVLKRALDREKARRSQAESLLESKSRELYLSYEKLRTSHEQLEYINKNLAEKQQALIDQQEEYMLLNNLHETVTRDLQVAADLQQQILPDSKRYGEFEVRGLCKPAMFVAGDVYDYFRLSDSAMAFYMADVTGHGPAAAMISYSIHKQLNPTSSGLCASAFRSCSSVEDAVSRIVAELNNEYAGLRGDSHYFTLIFGIMEFNTGEIYFTQAGHPPPMHYEIGSGKVNEIGDGGFPVGMFKDLEYKSYGCTLDAGDSFYIYSDGITECFSPAMEEFGRHRLSDSIEGAQNAGLSETLQSVVDNTTSWNDRPEFSDDVSIIGIKRH